MSVTKAMSVSFVLFLIASPSQAVTVVSNLSEPYEVTLTSDGAHFAAAGSFLTSSGVYTLNSVTLPIQVNSELGDTTGLRFRADNSGMPGALLEGLGSQFAPQGQTILTYNSIGCLLAANTTYWLTLGETGSGGGQGWNGTFSTAESSPVGWTIGNQGMNSSDGGASWNPYEIGPPNESPIFAIDASAALAGDYNFDGTVDAADYVVWRKVDGSQQGYDTWRANFGQSVGSGSVSNTTVPEPTTALLLILGTALGSWGGRLVASRVPTSP